MLSATPTLMIQFVCSGCKARIRAPRQLVGSARPCPRCRQRLDIHVTLPSEADICLVPLDVKTARR
jgi:hypothetical protein